MDTMEITDTYTEAEMKKDYAQLVAKERGAIVSCHHREGMKVIENFQPHFWSVAGPDGRSIATLWNDTEARKCAEERALKHYKKLYKSEVRRNLAFLNNVPLPTSYRPALAKSIVRHTSAKEVLDPCAGWGGRMLGAISAGAHYTACEPSTATHRGLTQMLDFLDAGGQAVIHKEAAEVRLRELPSAHFDLVITSPPYFNLEIYSSETTQSTHTFATWDEWLDGFLRPVITECLRCLKPRGVSAWSVKDMPRHPLKQKVIEFHEKHGFKVVEVFGMSSTRRNTGKKALVTEETLLFSYIE